MILRKHARDYTISFSSFCCEKILEAIQKRLEDARSMKISNIFFVTMSENPFSLCLN